MSNQVEKIFAKGFNFKRRENAPDFVVGSLSIKVSDAISFIEEYKKNEWVNLDIKKSSKGSFYLELDTYVPTPSAEQSNNSAKNDDLPF